MNITVHIERLVLDGVVTSTRDGRAVQQALEAALCESLAQPDAMSALSTRSVQDAGATAVRRAEAVAPAAGAAPAAWGPAIAQAVSGTLA